MRTTVALDLDAESAVRRHMAQRDVPSEQAVNDATRAGTAAPAEAASSTRVHSMGRPTLNLDRALQLAGELEDEEAIRRMRSGR